MRKLWKALVGILAAVAMLAAGGLMSTSASADDTANPVTGSITISNAKKGHEYKAYKIFDVASQKVEGAGENVTTKVSYTLAANSPWDDFFKAGAAGATYVSLDGNRTVSWIKDSDPETDGVQMSTEDAKAFADAAIAYIKTTSKQFNEFTEPADADGELKFENLPLGYYLVTSTVGTLVSLDTTLPKDENGEPVAEITDKNEGPEVEKKVQEDSGDKGESNWTDGWEDQNDAQIGEKVKFQTTITAQEGALNYVLHDQMQAGLTFDLSSIKVTLDYAEESKENKVLSGTGENADYTVAAPVTHTVGDKTETDTFDMAFSKALLDSLKDGDKLIVQYTATVNKDANIDTDGNENTTHLDYGDENHTSHTPDDTTTTYVWDFNVYKYAQDGETKTPLKDAKFKLTIDEAGNNAVEFVKKTDKDDKVVPNQYRVFDSASDTTTDKVTEFTTDNTGKFNLSGLDSGTYWLHETKAPAGYNKLDNPIKVEIKTASDPVNMGKVVYTFDGMAYETTDKTVNVLNQAGSELPGTGGMGATVLYAAGAVIVIAAALGLTVVLRKRQNAR